MKTEISYPIGQAARTALTPFFSIYRDFRFWFWAFLMLFGFVYVAGVLCGRDNPFASRHGGWDLIKLMLTLPFLFYFGPRHNLEPFSSNGWRLGLWIGLGYVLPFFIALHWLLLQRIPNINYSLTWSDLSHMHPTGQAVFLGAAVLLVGLSGYHFYCAYREGILKTYIATLLGAIGVIAAITFLLRNTHNVHIHHYFLFGFFIPWARFNTPVSLVCQALCAGVYVEGISEWGMATLWYLKH